MKVKDITGILQYGQAFEIRGAYSGKTYHKSYLNNERNLQKYLDEEVAEKPIYSDMRIRGSDTNHWCISVIVVWMHDYNMCKQREGEGI